MTECIHHTLCSGLIITSLNEHARQLVENIGALDHSIAGFRGKLVVGWAKKRIASSRRVVAVVTGVSLLEIF